MRGGVRGMVAVIRAVLAMMVVASTALAGPIAKPPAGWKGGANDELVHATGLIPHFGNVHGIIEAERYDAPQPGVVLDLTRVTATTSAPDAAARAEIEQLRVPADSGQRELEWREHWDAGRMWVDVWLVYRDPSTKVDGRVRMVIAASKLQIVAVKAECLTTDDADRELANACVAALYSLDPSMPIQERIPIDLDAKPSASTSTSTSTSTSSMSPPPHVPLPPMAIPQEQPKTDLRPIVVGAGIIALAIVFWWNRKRRARYEAENRENGSK